MNTATEIIPHSATPARASLEAVAIARVRTLDPAYFALVMATGIVAIAVHLTGMPFVGRILSWFNGVAFMVLVAMTLARAVFRPRLMFADLILLVATGLNTAGVAIGFCEQFMVAGILLLAGAGTAAAAIRFFEPAAKPAKTINVHPSLAVFIRIA